MMCSAGVKRVKQESPPQERSLQEEPVDSVVTVVTEMQGSRRQEPEHFLLKMESFSRSRMQKYVSDEFEAGGYKWNLIVYPNGDRERNGSNYISLYLSFFRQKMCPSGGKRVKRESSQEQQPLQEQSSQDQDLDPVVAVVTEMQGSRRQEPEHFMLKMESFSRSRMQKYVSDEFEAGGYKWNLIVYPNGDKERNGSNYISLYVSVTDAQKLPQGWEIEADFSLFVYNNISEKYQAYKLEGKTYFNWLKTYSGFPQLIPLNTFKETSNGYLFDDSCVFGAEINVTKSRSSGIARRQTISMMEEAGTDFDTDTNIFTWTVKNFATSNVVYIQSKEFIIGNVHWCLSFYPKGHGDGKGNSISLFLGVANDRFSKLPENQTVKAEYKLRIRNQLDTNHVEIQSTTVFSNSLPVRGCCNIMPLSEVHDESKGFVKNDSLVVEVEFIKVEIIKNFKSKALN